MAPHKAAMVCKRHEVTANVGVKLKAQLRICIILNMAVEAANAIAINMPALVAFLSSQVRATMDENSVSPSETDPQFVFQLKTTSAQIAFQSHNPISTSSQMVDKYDSFGPVRIGIGYIRGEC